MARRVERERRGVGVSFIRADVRVTRRARLVREMLLLRDAFIHCYLPPHSARSAVDAERAEERVNLELVRPSPDVAGSEVSLTTHRHP